jgi:hypothetical protein
MNALLQMESQEDNCLFVRDQHISIVILSRPSTEQSRLLKFVDLILAIAEFAEDLPRMRPRQDPDQPIFRRVLEIQRDTALPPPKGGRRAGEVRTGEAGRGEVRQVRTGGGDDPQQLYSMYQSNKENPEDNQKRDLNESLPFFNGQNTPQISSNQIGYGNRNSNII